MHRVLVLNPMSGRTEVAVFHGAEPAVVETLAHSPEELAAFERVWDQYLFRKDRISDFLQRQGVTLASLAAVVGRGGLLKPVPGGTYRVNAAMLEDLRRGARGEHAANLGGILAYGIARACGIPAFIADPVTVDEMDAVARVSGLPEVQRKSVHHALNMREAARRAAQDLGKPYEQVNLVVAHLGVGISVTPHRRGRMPDTANALEGGPFSPERAGMVPVGDLVRLCFSGRYTEREMVQKLTAQGGLTAYLGTGDWTEAERRIEQGDPLARLVYEAMAYQIAKEIGAMAAVLDGHVDALVLTGPMAASELLVDWIRSRAGWIAPLRVYPGSFELAALAAGALRVLNGEEPAREYE